MLDDLAVLRVLVDGVRGRIQHARRDETGGLSLEWLAVILGILTIAGIVVAIVVQKATSAANKIQIP
jgi:uncharacterized protein (UPF0333 family)